MEYLSHFIVWTLTVFGIANAFKLASILEPFREYLAYSKITERDTNGRVKGAIARKNQFWFKLFTCPLCLSFHIGWLLSIFVWSPTGDNVFFLQRIISDAFLGSISGWLWYIFTINKQMGVN